MSYLTESREPLNIQKLSYAAETNMLSIGNNSVKLDETIADTNYFRFLADQPRRNQFAESRVAIGLFGNPVAGEEFHLWLGGLLSQEERLARIAKSTLEAMYKVTTSIRPDLKEFTNADDSGPFGFNFYVDQHRHITLHVLGDCACLGPNPDGFLANHRDWDEESLCEYTFHNVDQDFQRWGLLAGLGHLAVLSETEPAI